MTLVTLVGRLMAKVGNEFIYCGPVSACKECRIKKVCFNLHQGKRYRVISVREKTHDCIVNEDKVNIVEVEEIPSLITLPKRLAIEGSTITFEPQGCNNLGCDNYSECIPFGLASGTKLKVLKALDKVECEDGNYLIRVEVS